MRYRVRVRVRYWVTSWAIHRVTYWGICRVTYWKIRRVTYWVICSSQIGFVPCGYKWVIGFLGWLDLPSSSSHG